jgi:hypothetical protein
MALLQSESLWDSTVCTIPEQLLENAALLQTSSEDGGTCSGHTLVREKP